MTVSLLLAQEVLKLFLILFMGYILVRIGLLGTADSKSVSVILVYLVIPCVILDSFQVVYTPEVRTGLLMAFGLAAVIHVFFILLTRWIKNILKLDRIERATLIYTNAGILVIPLVKALLGDEYVIYSCAFMAVQLILLWSHCRRMFCSEERMAWKKILLNVNVIAIGIGLLMFIFQIMFPPIIGDALGMTASMMGPMGMLLAGMTIAEMPLKEVFFRRRNYLATILRLIVYPILVLFLLKITGMCGMIPNGKVIVMTVYLSTITPACSTITSMAQLYERDAGYASTLYVLTTLFSIVTMPVMIGLFDILI